MEVLMGRQLCSLGRKSLNTHLNKRISTSTPIKHLLANNLNNLEDAEDDQGPVIVSSDKIPFRNQYSRRMCDLRRNWVEQYSKTELKHVSKWWGNGVKDDPEILKGIKWF